MTSDTYKVLGAQYNALNTLYEENRETVDALQRTLIKGILPGLVDELEWDEEEKTYAQQWLEDTPSIFRTLKRHEFTTSFALEALQNTLWWRLTTLPSLAPEPPSPHLLCLPQSSSDPFGRPILILKLAALCQGATDLKGTFAHNMELLRLHLVQLNASNVQESESDPDVIPIMQYIVLVDISGMSLNTVQNINLLSWFVHELLPRFPGMLGAVFVLNYSWAHAGLWNVAKRILPASALQKVFFPTDTELLEYFTPAVLPRELGGELPPEGEIENPLYAYVPAQPVPSKPSNSPSDPSFPNGTSHHLSPQAVGPSDPSWRSTVSSTSLFNPFFGYPLSSHGSTSSSAPTLRHGRRRKRDLLKTLAKMWWARWKKRIGAILLLIVFMMMVRKRRWFAALLKWWRTRRIMGTRI